MATQQERQAVLVTLEDFSKKVFETIFDKSKPAFEYEGRSFPIRMFVNDTIRGVDLPINGKSIRFIEQNPRTNSSYAARANNGEQIMWLIENGVQNGYLGRVEKNSQGKLIWFKLRNF